MYWDRSQNMSKPNNTRVLGEYIQGEYIHLWMDDEKKPEQSRNNSTSTRTKMPPSSNRLGQPAYYKKH